MTGPGQALCGQTWDLATDNMPFVLLVRRRPAGAPATLALTLVGCLSLIGMNDAGLAIGTTNVRTSDSRPGVGYLDIIHKALALTDLGDAAAAITGAHRAGAHYYYLLDARGRALAIECTATDAAALPIDRGAYVHCNHMRVARHRAVEKDTPGSTREREARLTALIAAASRPIGVETLKTFLADHDQSPRCICRHDFGGSSSNGSMIMCPTRGRAWAVHGQACAGDWIELSV
jgi:isopenicillin-N N-acyltransferase-like protein